MFAGIPEDTLHNVGEFFLEHQFSLFKQGDVDDGTLS
jgi:hypothetical protein